MYKLWNQNTKQYGQFTTRWVITPGAPIVLDIGELCTHCGRDSNLGPDLLGDRIPSDADAELILQKQNIRITVQGYMCTDCQAMPCDYCGKATIDYDIIDGDITCQVCKLISEPQRIAK